MSNINLIQLKKIMEYKKDHKLFFSNLTKIIIKPLFYEDNGDSTNFFFYFRNSYFKSEEILKKKSYLEKFLKIFFIILIIHKKETEKRNKDFNYLYFILFDISLFTYLNNYNVDEILNKYLNYTFKYNEKIKSLENKNIEAKSLGNFFLNYINTDNLDIFFIDQKIDNKFEKFEDLDSDDLKLLKGIVKKIANTKILNYLISTKINELIIEFESTITESIESSKINLAVKKPETKSEI